MKPLIELIYDSDCPNIGLMRIQTLKALKEAGLPLGWREWQRADQDAPGYVHDYGSPTLLIDGVDAVGHTPDGATCCRVYHDADGHIAPVPELEAIVWALVRTGSAVAPLQSQSAQRNWFGVSAMPAILMALVPKLTCPMCWPAYASLLSSLGVGYFNYTPWLLPLTTMFLIVTLFVQAHQASRHGHWLALGPGILGGSIVMIGRFVWHSDPLVYLGLVALIWGALWNSFLASRANSREDETACTSCRCTGSGKERR